ncbi:MAG: MBL fold metallo-hydrolase [Eggerthellaceae bacterium]
MPASLDRSPGNERPALADAARRAPDIATSARDAWRGGRLSERARCVLADNPSPLTYLGTNTWILSEPGCSGCVVVDPGPAMKGPPGRGARRRGRGRPRGRPRGAHTTTPTTPRAPRRSPMPCAPLVGRRAGTLPDGPLSVGVPGPRLEVLSLPGHSSDSVGFAFPDDGSIVTGDFIFLQSSTLICWPDGGLSEYLESLDALHRIVREQGAKTLLTAHGLPIVDPLSIIERQGRHRRKRLERVKAVIEDGAGRDLDRIMERVYKDVDARLNPAARCNVQAQLAYLEERGEL